MPNEHLYHNYLDRSISSRRVSDYILYNHGLQIFHIFSPNQPQCSVASDLGIHCLLMFMLCSARHKWPLNGLEF